MKKENYNNNTDQFNLLEDVEENYTTGYVSLYRSFINWEWFSVPNMVTVFIYCLLKANFKDKSWRGIEIKRGSFISSLENIANDTNLTKQQVRTSLKRLQKTKEIHTQSNTRNTVITICKYDSYQRFHKLANTQSNKQATHKQHTDNKRITTTNNDNKENKENNIKIIDVTNPPNGVSSLYFYIAKSYHILFLKKGITRTLEKAKLDKWVDDVRKIVEIDKIKIEQLVAIKMYWELCESGEERDRFWFDTVNSMASFRKKDKNDEYYFDKITQSVKKWLDTNPKYINEVKSRYNNLIKKADGSSK